MSAVQAKFQAIIKSQPKINESYNISNIDDKLLAQLFDPKETWFLTFFHTLNLIDLPKLHAKFNRFTQRFPEIFKAVTPVAMKVKDYRGNSNDIVAYNSAISRAITRVLKEELGLPPDEWDEPNHGLDPRLPIAEFPIIRETELMFDWFTVRALDYLKHDQ